MECHGEIVTYREVFNVSSVADADLLTYMAMFADLTNTSNTTLLNVSATPFDPAAYPGFRSIYFGDGPPSPPMPPPIYRPRDPVLVDERGERIVPPQMARTNALKPLYYIRGEWLGDAGGIPNGTRRSDCAAALEGRALVLMEIRFLFQSYASREETMQLLYGGTVDRSLLRFGVRSCWSEQFRNVRLECDPAPSPPPVGDWVVPPSPPAFGYELVVASAAFGGSGLLFGFGCLCCLCFLGGSTRSRHTSRMLGTKLLRVDEMPYVRREYAERGEEPRGIVAGRESDSTQYSFASLFGGRTAAAAWAKVSTD